MDARFANLKVAAAGSSLGGSGPHPPFHDYPLLAWNPKHPKYAASVFTEDGRASVQDIATAYVTNPDFPALATRFGTTENHVRQAVAYAATAGFLVPA